MWRAARFRQQVPLLFITIAWYKIYVKDRNLDVIGLTLRYLVLPITSAILNSGLWFPCRQVTKDSIQQQGIGRAVLYDVKELPELQDAVSSRAYENMDALYDTDMCLIRVWHDRDLQATVEQQG